MARDDFYTVAEAAKVLGITDRRVRQLMDSGEIEATREEGRWKLFRRSVHSLRDARRASSGFLEDAESRVETRELRERVEALQRELGRVEGRLELTEVTESTLRENLERERGRADRLEEELREARRPWWRRMFGGE